MEKEIKSIQSQLNNFDITVSFIGFMYGIYADLPMTYIAAAPYMTGGAEYWKNNVASGRFKFRDKNGNPYGNMCTFPELKAKITEASKNEEVMSAASKGEEIAGSYDQQINAINAIKDAYPFDKNGWTLTKKASEYEGLSGENRAKVITFKNDKNYKALFKHLWANFQRV